MKNQSQITNHQPPITGHKSLTTNHQSLAIALQNVSKKYILAQERPILLKNLFAPQKKEEVWALKNVSLTLKKGETIGIIGENGSGKSTLLKIIAGITTPTKGSIRVNGRIGSLIELGAGFHQDLTGRENIYLNGALLGFTKKELDKKYREIVEFADIGEYITQPIRTYSSGMTVRLGFSVAVHLDPDILLIDEVLAVGDEEFQMKCLRFMANLHEQSTSIVFVSHNLNFIEHFANRVVFLKQGRVEIIGSPEKTVDRYRKTIKVVKNKIYSKDYQKDIQIKSVSIIDKKGIEKNMFDAGEEMTALVNYKINKKVDNPVFNLQIFRTDGVFCHGENTFRHDLKLNELPKVGQIKLKYSQINFLQGKYFLSARVYSKKSVAMIPLDELEEAQKIVINSKKKEGGGIVRMETKWIIN